MQQTLRLLLEYAEKLGSVYIVYTALNSIEDGAMNCRWMAAGGGSAFVVGGIGSCVEATAH